MSRTPNGFSISDTPYWNAFVIGYQNPAASYIGEKLFPRAKVPARAFKFRKYDLGNSFTLPNNMEISSMGKFAKKEQKYSYETGLVKDYGVYTELSNQDLYDAKELSSLQYDLKADALTDLLIAQDNRYEIDAATTAQTYTNYASGHYITLTTNGSGAPYWWSDTTNSDPPAEIDKRKLTYVTEPYNTFWISELGWYYLAKHPKTMQRCFGTTLAASIVTPEIFGRVMGFEQVLIGAAKKSTTKFDKTPSLTGMWSSYAGMATVKKTVQYYGAQTFGYTGWYNPTSSSSRRNVIQLALDPLEYGNWGGIQIGVGCQEAINICDSNMGYLWTSCIDPTSNPQT
jgi:hypothetical protein